MAQVKRSGVERRRAAPARGRYTQGGALAVIFGALVYITNLLLDPASQVLFAAVLRGICG